MKLKLRNLIMFFSILIILFSLFFKSLILKQIFNISGEISIVTKNYNFKYNNTLFIIVKNSKDIPIAIKKVINPTFPLKFNIKKENIIYPNLLTYNLKVESILNSHGEIGKLKKGDFYSSIPQYSFIFSKNIKINIDSQY